MSAQYAHRLEYVQHALILHAFQHNAERDEDASASNAGATVHRYGPILTELLLGLVHLPDEINEAPTRFRHALFGPIDELELAYGARGAITCIGYLVL